MEKETKKATPTPEVKKADVVRALRISPSNEKVIIYETGAAWDIAKKLHNMRTTKVTVLVLK